MNKPRLPFKPSLPSLFAILVILFLTSARLWAGDKPMNVVVQLADKWYPYEESIRVPIIIRDPRLPEESHGSTIDEFALNVDLAPTILRALGFEVPGSSQGEDLSLLYLSEKQAAQNWRNQFFYEHGTISNKHRIPSSQAVVTETLKYTWWPEWKFEELYDLSHDPLEQNNLADDPSYQTQLENMRIKLHSMKTAVE